MKLYKGNTAYREKLPKHGNFKNRYEFPALHTCPIQGVVRPYTANYHPEFEIGELVYWSSSKMSQLQPGTITAREKANNRELGTHMWRYTVELDHPIRHMYPHATAKTVGNNGLIYSITTFALTRSRNVYESNCEHLLIERKED